MHERMIRRDALVGNRYQLESSLGKGGMADVWRALDRVTDQTVAVKFLRPSEEILAEVDTRHRTDALGSIYARFEREAKLLSAMNHRAIPKLLHTGNFRGTPYLVMELIDGGNLRAYLDRWEALPYQYAVAIAYEVASALECAHQKPVVHRDLKPQNIVLAADGAVFLLDFGIALPLNSGATRYTLYGGTVGSPGYQAPEQIRGDPVSPRTDSYGLGCVLFEMITGRKPFLPGGAGGLAGQHLDSVPPSLSEYSVSAPVEIDELTWQLLAKNPAERPSMGEVQERLSPFLPLPGSSAVPPPCPEPDPTRLFRRPGAGPAAIHNPAATVPEPSSGWLKRAKIRELCRQAEQELADDDPGVALRDLAGIAAAALAEWGTRDADARRVRLLAADGLRVLGECGRAEELYVQIAKDFQAQATVDGRTVTAICRLRAAECGLAFGKGGPALAALSAGDAIIRSLPQNNAAEVRAVWNDLVTNLRELRYEQQVHEVLAELGYSVPED